MSITESEKAEFFTLLKKLSEAVGVSGFEDEIRNVIYSEIRDYVDEVKVDSLGNLIGIRRGKGEGKVMIAAHMDEIGLMITHIEKNGFLRFTGVGGWSDRILPGQRVVILTSKGRVRGVIGSKPPHLLTPEEAKQVIEAKKLFIDVGVSSREEVESLGIKVGSIAVMDRDMVRLGGSDVVSGKAFDDRVGVAVMIHALKLLEKEDVKVDVYAVATIQEEVGLKGAMVSAYSINPDVGLAVDVTTANDVPEVPEKDAVTMLGKGPAIKVMDGGRGGLFISHPKVREFLIKVAEEGKIPYQLEVLIGGTTDATAIMLRRNGIPSCTISIPTRYIHSPTETLNIKDAIYAAKLLASSIKRMDKVWIESLKGATLKA